MNSKSNQKVPLAWEITTIGEITLPYETIQPKKFPDEEFKYIDIGSIDNSNQTITNPKIFLGKDAPSRARRVVKQGDVVFSTVRTYLKNIARVPAELDGVITSTGIAVLRTTLEFENNFLFHYVSCDEFIRKISGEMDGTLYPAVTDNDVYSASISLPPLNEQKRIVTKIEALQTRSTAVKQELEAIKPLLNQFRQSVLAAAFRGDLTKDWREQNPDVEPAEVLFKDSNDLVISHKPIPKTWIHIKLNSLINKIQAGKNFKCPEIPVNQDTVGLVKISAVTWGKFNPQETKTVDDESKINPDLFINKGDFLVSRANTIELVGASVIVEEINYQIMISDKVWRILTNEKANKQYIDFFLKSKQGRKEIETRATGNQQSMRNIAQKAFNAIEIPYAPLQEQKEIVRRIESLFKLADNIQQQYQQAKVELETLNQSILAKAFRGELVPQDPNDEPASVLLERIRAERDKAKPKKSKTEKKRSSKTEDKQLGIPGI